MNHRRFIGSLLALALLAGQTFVPLARAACAVPKAAPAAKSPACPSCTGGPATAAPSITVDRSCCAAPSLADRDPATTAPDRASASGDQRALAAAATLPPARALQVFAPAKTPRSASDPPGASSPLLRTTILLI